MEYYLKLFWLIYGKTSVWTLRARSSLYRALVLIQCYMCRFIFLEFSCYFFPNREFFFSAASILERDKAPGFKLERCLSCDFLRWYHCNTLLFLKLSFNYSACKSIPLVWRSVVSYTFKSRLVISKAFSFAVNHCNMWSHS